MTLEEMLEATTILELLDKKKHLRSVLTELVRSTVYLESNRVHIASSQVMTKSVLLNPLHSRCDLDCPVVRTQQCRMNRLTLYTERLEHINGRTVFRPRR